MKTSEGQMKTAVFWIHIKLCAALFTPSTGARFVNLIAIEVFADCYTSTRYYRITCVII